MTILFFSSYSVVMQLAHFAFFVFFLLLKEFVGLIYNFNWLHTSSFFFHF